MPRGRKPKVEMTLEEQIAATNAELLDLQEQVKAKKAKLKELKNQVEKENQDKILAAAAASNMSTEEIIAMLSGKNADAKAANLESV